MYFTACFFGQAVLQKIAVTFLLYDLFSFLNDLDIQLILEFNNSFVKYQQVVLKIPLCEVLIY